MKETIKETILVCTPEPISAIGASVALAPEFAVTVCDGVPQLQQMINAGELKNYDLLLVDFVVGVGFPTIKNASNQSKVIVWIGHAEPGIAMQNLTAGARGLLRKTASIDEVKNCIREVTRGGISMPKGLADQILLGRKISLTRREGQLIALLSQGLKNKEIARILCVRKTTVKVYFSHLFQKTGAKDRFELALYGLRNGINSSDLGHDAPRTMLMEPFLREQNPSLCRAGRNPLPVRTFVPASTVPSDEDTE